MQLAQQRIANSLLQSEDTGSDQLFANSNFYSRENLNNITVSKIADIAKSTINAPKDENLRAFVRTVPVVSSQIPASTPDWAIGSKAVETMGPFINSDGRYVWVDIYKTVKLTTLYLCTQPVLLFNASTIALAIVNKNSYTIAAGTVWINASLLSAGAPVNRFVGVKVKSGSLKLSIATSQQNGKATLNPATNMDMSLTMVQDTDEGASSTSAFGKDARESKYQLPESLQFTWNGTSKKITALSIGNATAEMYGQTFNFSYNANSAPAISYNAVLNAVTFQWQNDKPEFKVLKNNSPFITVSEAAPILKSYWFLQAGVLNVDSPVEAEGNGGILLECGKGLRAAWSNLENEEARLIQPFIMGLPGSLFITDFNADTSAASQHFDLWKDGQHPYSSSIDLTFFKGAPLLINISSGKSQEFITTQCNGDFKIDRPVKVNGEPFDIDSKTSVLMLGASDASKLIYLYDDNIIADNTTVAGVAPKPVAIALENALFTVSQVNGCLLFGECSDDWEKISRANLFLLFHLLRYLPTLPDPYVGRLSMWERLFGRGDNRLTASNTNFLTQLICAIKYNRENENGDKVSTNFYFGTIPPGVTQLPDNNDANNAASSSSENAGKKPTLKRKNTTKKEERVLASTVKSKVALAAKNPLVNLRSALIKPLSSVGTITNSVKINAAFLEKAATENNQLLEGLQLAPGIGSLLQTDTPVIATATTGQELQVKIRQLKNDLERVWDDAILGGRLSAEPFALLDISSNANQLGISISNDLIIVKTGNVVRGNDNNATVAASNAWPFVVDGMQVKAKGQMVRSFTLPQIAWEPTINLTPPDKSDPPASTKLAMDPEAGYLFYEDDGGPTRIWNNNQEFVALAPVPVVDSLLEDFKSNPQNYTISAFTLPFGLKAISYVSKNFVEPTKPDITNLRPKFRKNADGTNQFEGGIQLSFTAGDFSKPVPTPPEKDSPMFPGYIIQQNNLLDMLGNKSGASNLGHRVTEIFNNEFLIGVLSLSNKLKDSRGVPVSRMDVTGYGANIFSNWLSPTAAMAQTSQARFDVMMGRTAHEVIQVKSILYPWGIRVVRTITVFRSGSGYIYRTDSGWKAESDGKFDFSYRYL